MRLRPREVMNLAAGYKKRVLNAVAEDLINYAERHAQQYVGAVTREVNEFLMTSMDQNAAMGALDKKIRERARLRKEDPILAQLTATKAGEKRYEGTGARL